MTEFCKYNENCKAYHEIDRTLIVATKGVCSGIYNQIGNCELHDLHAKIEEMESKSEKMNKLIDLVLKKD